MTTLSENLQPILTELHDLIWDADYEQNRPHWSKKNFRNATKLFMSCLLEFLYEKAIKDAKGVNIGSIAENAGKDMRNLILNYTGIDAHTFYRDENESKTS